MREFFYEVTDECPPERPGDSVVTVVTVNSDDHPDFIDVEVDGSFDMADPDDVAALEIAIRAELAESEDMEPDDTLVQMHDVDENDGAE